MTIVKINAETMSGSKKHDYHLRTGASVLLNVFLVPNIHLTNSNYRKTNCVLISSKIKLNQI